jgi:hypothetical protein
MKYTRYEDGGCVLLLTARERRRATAKRMKAKASRFGKFIKDANHLAACSCAMCRNPRHNPCLRVSQKLTVQERRELQEDNTHG